MRDFGAKLAQQAKRQVPVNTTQSYAKAPAAGEISGKGYFVLVDVDAREHKEVNEETEEVKVTLHSVIFTYTCIHPLTHTYVEGGKVVQQKGYAVGYTMRVYHNYIQTNNEWEKSGFEKLIRQIGDIVGAGVDITKLPYVTAPANNRAEEAAKFYSSFVGKVWYFDCTTRSTKAGASAKVQFFVNSKRLEANNLAEVVSEIRADGNPIDALSDAAISLWNGKNSNAKPIPDMAMIEDSPQEGGGEDEDTPF